jgi:endonuclease/exonuclease/phosphatase family metal-dependent hydrolase
MSLLSRPFYICTYNAKSICAQTRLLEFENEATKIKFDIIGLAETKIRNFGRIDYPTGCTLFYSGNRNAITHTGVGFYVNTALTTRIAGVTYHSERIIELQLKLGSSRTLRLVQVHAPHSGRNEAEYDTFLDELSTVLEARRATYTILMGDFNASTGPRDSNEQCIGNFGTGRRTNSGQKLVDFCDANGFVIGQTLFKKKINRRWTFINPLRQTYEIDYIITPHREFLMNVDVLSRFNAGSDHRLVRATMKLPQRIQLIRRRNQPIPAQMLDLDKARFTIEVQRNLACIDDDDPQTLYENICKALNDATDAARIPYSQFDRLTEATRHLLDRRRSLKFGISTAANRHARNELVNEYKVVCDQARTSLKEDLRRHHEQVMEAAVKSGRIRRGRLELSYGRRQLAQLRIDDDTLACTSEEILAHIQQFFEELYRSDVPQPPNRRAQFVPFTQQEVQRALNCRKPRGTPGEDEVIPLAAKLAAPLIANKLAAFYNEMFYTGRIPEKFCKANTILLPKKGDAADIRNYRPISLLSILYKTLSKILTIRIEDELYHTDALPGFRSKFSTTDHIQSVNMILEKSREFRIPFAMAFVDFEKAFDTIEHKSIWEALRHYGVDDGTIFLVRTLYSHGTSSIKAAGGTTKIKTQRGVRQGDSLSPLLFITTLQHALDSVDWNNRGFRIGRSKLQHLAYADDIALLAHGDRELQSMLDDVSAACRRIGLKINAKKTEWMSHAPADRQLKVGDKEIKRVDHFTYLGQRVSFPRSFDKEIGLRIGAGWAAFNKHKKFFTNRSVDMKLKRRLYHQCVFPSILFGCETWALTKSEEERLAVAQRKMERSMCNVWQQQEHLSNKQLRRRTRLKDVIRAYRLRKWNFARQLLSRDRWTRTLTLWNPKDDGYKRPIGRPRTRWENDLNRFSPGGVWRTTAQNERIWE